jgi:hypothetical protein
VRRVGGFADRLSSRFQHVAIEALIGRWQASFKSWFRCSNLVPWSRGPVPTPGKRSPRQVPETAGKLAPGEGSTSGGDR